MACLINGCNPGINFVYLGFSYVLGKLSYQAHRFLVDAEISSEDGISNIFLPKKKDVKKQTDL